MVADPDQGRAVLDEVPGVGGMELRPGKLSTNFGDRTLADHLISLDKERWRDRQSEGFGGLEIDNQLELGRLLHR